MNWKLTATKSLVVGVLAALGIWQADVLVANPVWALVAVAVIELARDLIKRRYGSFIPTAK